MLVEALDVADGENADVEGGVVEDVMDELGRDGEAVEGEDLDIPQNVEALEAGEDVTEGTGVVAAVVSISKST